VHRVSQWLRRVKILHPDRRSVADRVDGVVVGHPCVPEDSAPEANIDRIWLPRDGELYLLRTRAVDDASVRPRQRRDRSGKVDVLLLQLPDVASQPHGELVVGDRHQRPRAIEP
jgi:hypothetical protein